jgi:hypothetical protein
MRGLDPRIHPVRQHASQNMDCRVEPGNDVTPTLMIARRNAYFAGEVPTVAALPLPSCCAICK